MSVPIVDAHDAFTARLAELQFWQARMGEDALINLSPDALAVRTRAIADMARVEEQPSAATWASIGALALAGWVSAARSEELRVDTGDEAA